MITKTFLAFCSLLFVAFAASAQDEDLFKMMETNQKPVTNYATATFKSTRVINGHSVENMAAKHLDFRISHRFGQLSSGAYNLWGLDQATIRLALEYGITDRLMVGLGRSSNQKEYDGFAKFKLLRQATGEKSMPITLSLFGSVVVNTLEVNLPKPTDTYAFTNRLTYTSQLLIGRKVSERFSFQLTPTWIHRNLVATTADAHDVFALGFGGRAKISKRVSFNVDYFYVFSEQILKTNYNSLALGFDIETGGHVFQLQFTNSIGMIEKAFITETTGDWGKGNIHYGFNISRTFSLVGKKQKQTK
jgi:hypothetical protein